jgi:protein gp37
MATTSIEWTDATWNPVAGCSIVSAGCTNCYAMRMASRLQAMGMQKYKGLTRRSGSRHVWTGKVTCHFESLEVPLAWRKPKRIFVNSMSDLFHEAVPNSFIKKIWKVMADTPHHTYQILTKRTERMASLVGTPAIPTLPHVWLGTSVEGKDALFRLDQLRKAPAAIRFVSFEPLLNSVQGANLDGIAWAIVGGESGPRARPMIDKWVDEIEEMCRAQGVAFFFKQWGGVRKKQKGRKRRGRIYDEMPELTIDGALN